MNRVRICLWFDTQAEEAARYYTAIFKDSKLGTIAHYPEAGQEVHGKPAGSVMTVEFELNGQQFIALNGGPDFTFNEAVSIEITCKDQEELDYYWDRLRESGDPEAQVCGWLKDKYGLSWQVVPDGLDEVLNDPDEAKSTKAYTAMLRMKKLDLEAMKAAAIA